MPKSPLTIILFIVAAGLMGGSGERSITAQGAAGSSVAKGGKTVDRTKTLHAVLIGDKAKGHIEDVLTIDVVIRNDGPETIYLFRRLEWGIGGGLALMIKNDRGERVPTGDRILWPPLPPNDPAMLVQLDEDRFFGARRELDVKRFFRSPGKYTLQVEYVSPIFRAAYGDKLPNLPIVSGEDPAIYSNELTFEVLP